MDTLFSKSASNYFERIEKLNDFQDIDRYFFTFIDKNYLFLNT